MEKQRPSYGSPMPTIDQLKREINKTDYQQNFRTTLWRTISVLVVVAAVAILISTQFIPVLQITGTSMTPTLSDGEMVLTIRGAQFKKGDIIAFYYNNKILIKRVIANAGEWVKIDEDGQVYVDNVPLDEPYVTDMSLGDCDIEMPYQVPDGRLFVMGDHRATSADSRNTAIGCVSEEQVVGRILFRIWPFDAIGVL